ncbi:MAG TPA: hypothetical protein VGC58_00675 [Candidatus Paceibacterota bacterium]
MDKYLAAMQRFADNPASLGENIFTLCGTITGMNWEEVTALGSALRLLTDEAWRVAKEREGGDGSKALNDVTHKRLDGFFIPISVRVGALIVEAPLENRLGLIEAVTYRSSGGGFISPSVTERWRSTMLGRSGEDDSSRQRPYQGAVSPV